jgi:hypothetical protein
MMSTGRAVVQEGHILHRHDLGDDALVAVAAGHLVAFGQILRRWATLTRTIFSTPAGRSRCRLR